MSMNEHIAGCACGCILVRRYTKGDIVFCGKDHNVSRIIGMNDVEILHRYRGIEGDLWPSESILKFGVSDDDAFVAGQDAPRVLDYHSHLQAVHPENTYDSLFVTIGGNEPVHAFTYPFLGYDCGYMAGPYDYYSAIYNEIIYGKYEKINEYAIRLNGALLFDELLDAQAFVAFRDKALTFGCDLETHEMPFVPIAIRSLVL